MESYFKFWRLFPRFFFGGAFVVVIFFSIFGPQGMVQILDHFKSFNFQVFGNVLSGLLVVVALIVISSFGLFLLELMVNVIEWLMSLLASIKIINRFAAQVGVAELILPTHQVCLKLFIENSKDIIGYLYLKSWAQPEDVEKIKMLKTHAHEVEKHMKEISNSRLLEDLSFYTAVTQEQARMNHLRDELRDIYYFIALAFVIIAMIMPYGLLKYVWIYLILGFLITSIILIPIMKQKKIRLASYILIGYIDVFTLGEGATVSDRESM